LKSVKQFITMKSTLKLTLTISNKIDNLKLKSFHNFIFELINKKEKKRER